MANLEDFYPDKGKVYMFSSVVFNPSEIFDRELKELEELPFILQISMFKLLGDTKPKILIIVPYPIPHEARKFLEDIVNKKKFSYPQYDWQIGYHYFCLKKNTEPPQRDDLFFE